LSEYDTEGKSYLQDPAVDARMIPEWILKELGMRIWTGFNWVRAETRGLLL
jgi:hypothetical protein